MGLIHLIKSFALTIRESATDGSDFSNPDADYRVLFLGEDGLLHVKDSAGAVTSPYSSGAAGALVFLEAHTASASASLDFTTFISSTYDTYKIEGVALILATNTANLYMEVGTGGGPTWDTGDNYEWVRVGANTATGAASNDNGSGAGGTGPMRIFLSMANAAGYGTGSFSLTATSLQSTAIRKTFQGTQQYVHTTGPTSLAGAYMGQWVTSGTAATGLRFIASSGNITSGTIRIYGVAKS